MKMTGAVFAKAYGEGSTMYTKYTWCEVNDSLTIDWWREQGYIYVCDANFEHRELSYEDIVTGTVANLRGEQQRKRAECERDCTTIDARISRLLQIEYVEPADRMPRRAGQRDVTDAPSKDLPF